MNGQASAGLCAASKYSCTAHLRKCWIQISAGILQLDNHMLSGCLKSAICSARSKTQISWKSPNLNHFGIILRKYVNFKRSYNFTFSLLFPRWCSRGVLTFIFITIKFTLVMVSYKPYNQCPAGTRTRPATRYFFRYPTRPDSVLEIIG